MSRFSGPDAALCQLILDRGLLSERQLSLAASDSEGRSVVVVLLDSGLLDHETLQQLKAELIATPPPVAPGDYEATLRFEDAAFLDADQGEPDGFGNEELVLDEDEPVPAVSMRTEEMELDPSFRMQGPLPESATRDGGVDSDSDSSQAVVRVEFDVDTDSERLESSDLNLLPNLTTPAPLAKPLVEPAGEDIALAESVVTSGQLETMPPDQGETQEASRPESGATHGSAGSVSTPPSEDQALSPGVVGEVSRSRQMSHSDLERIRRVVEGGADSLIGVNLGGYRVEGRIGAGGMGDVYEATQLSLNRKVALKVLPTQFTSSEEFVGRFYTEARTLGTFVHSNIVQVYDVGEAAGLHFFTMERVAGHSFKDLVDADETIAPEVCTNLLKQTIRGLSRAQEAGVIHRDVKPGNLLISDQGDVKVVDFGLSQTVDDKGEFQSASVVGTPLYISPEAVSGRPITFKSDMYSLGATMFHLLTGRPPFKGSSAIATAHMHVNSPVPDPSDVNTAIPRGFASIVMRMMAKVPGDRFAGYRELFDSVEEFELRQGIIKSRSDFLADSLLAIGEHGIRGIWNKVGFMAITGGALAVMALGIHNTLESHRLHDWIALCGDAGTLLFALTVLFITYVALARKRIVPVVGSIRGWMYAHIVSAAAAFLLVSVHSGNYFRWFIHQGVRINQYPDRTIADVVPHVAFLNSVVFLIVILSGLIGATIWRDILKQVNAERIASGQEGLADDSGLTLSVFSQTAFKYWRMLHYPLAVSLGVLTLIHVLSILYYRGL